MNERSSAKQHIAKKKLGKKYKRNTVRGT